MLIYNTDFKVDREEVIRELGYKDAAAIESHILEEIMEEINAARTIVKPRIVYAEYPVSVDSSNERLILPNGALTPGPRILGHLSRADTLIIAVATIGDEVHGDQSSISQHNDLFSIFLRDAIGTVALYELQRSFWKWQTNLAVQQSMGVTGLFCPGEGEWNIRDQFTLFDNVNTTAIGVVINRHYVMQPIKSVSMVCGIGSKITTPQNGHQCSDCINDTCSQRRCN
jgi:hypothetical protein